MSEESRELLRLFENIPPCERDFKNSVAALRNEDPKVKFASRKQLKKAVKRHFLAAFGHQYMPESSVTDDMRFRMRCRGWIISTEFDFGRWYPEIRYRHYIRTGKSITKEEPPVLLANSLAFQLAYGYEIGFGSGWTFLAEEEVKADEKAPIFHRPAKQSGCGESLRDTTRN